MIMAASAQNIFKSQSLATETSACSVALDECAQSIIEFLLLLPVIVILSVVFTRVNSAIQVSIVNQKYARAQALWLAFNSPWFPRQALLKDNFIDTNYTQMVIGMSDEQVSGSGTIAKATEQVVVRDRSQALPGPSQDEPAQRSIVRVRTTVAMCTAPMFATSSNNETNYYTGSGWAETTTPNLCRGQGGP